MCGIAGILQSPHATRRADLAAIGRMTASLRHRGPDGEGCWLDRHAGIALGHRRLAIVDLTEAGRQPMVSESGRFVITFNGEIYNHALLRQELERQGQRFRGSSDTEVLLAMVERWGLENALQRSNGMFAIGLWDGRTRTLHLARDRMGKKPLYVALIHGAAVFASELKAITAFPGFTAEIDLRAVSEFLGRGWLPDDHCIWRGVFKVPPGTILSFKADDLTSVPDAAALRTRARPYWSLIEQAVNGRANCRLDDHELVDELDGLLRRAVAERMVADVPVGLFLSGGIDSSTVVALMQSQLSRPVRTFTIGFKEAGFDEAASAAAVARHLGTDHTEFRLTPGEARAVIPELGHIWDEPFADESQIPTLLLSRLARRDVTVVLSGDGGDECFGGYSRHLLTQRLGFLLNSNRGLRRATATGIAFLARGLPESFADSAPIPGQLRRAVQGDRLNRLAEMVGGEQVNETYWRAMRLSELQPAAEPMPSDPAMLPPLHDLLSDFILRDMLGYLPGDILVKLDRASMATSLEARCPILDHRIVEFSWALPNAAKVRHGKGKWILRQVLERYLPRRLFDRPKQGFDVPVGAWLRGPLRSWAADLLCEQNLRKHGLLNAPLVESCWLEHLAGRRDHSRILWAVLMLQSWLQASAVISPAAQSLEPAE